MKRKGVLFQTIKTFIVPPENIFVYIPEKIIAGKWNAKKYFQLSFSRSFLAGELWNTIMEEDESSNKIDSLLLTPPKKKKKESCFIHVYKGNDLRVRRITDLSLERLKQAR